MPSNERRFGTEMEMEGEGVWGCGDDVFSVLVSVFLVTAIGLGTATRPPSNMTIFGIGDDIDFGFGSTALVFFDGDFDFT